MHTLSSVGKARRFGRLRSPVTNRILLVPLDDSLLAGPTLGLEDLKAIITKIVSGSPDAVMGFHGLFRSFAESFPQIPWILNLTASTTRSHHTRKILAGSLDQAVRLGADAVAVHVNITSKYESEMLRILGQVSAECDHLGMPLMAIMYPRSEGADGDENYAELKERDRSRYADLVAHAARVGTELGADLIKTQYTGDSDSFRRVVDACSPIPVLAAGGPLVDFESMLEMAHGVINSGAAGVSFGRNVFGRPDPKSAVAALRAIIHENVSPKEAMERYHTPPSQV